jgi:hypothetical protein
MSSEPFVPKLVKMCAQSTQAPKGSKKGDPKMKPGKKDEKGRKRLQAAFMKSKIWPSNTTIKIGFLKEPGDEIPRTDVEIMEKKVDADGNSLKIDPLQRAVTNLSIKEAIIKVVTERLQPIVNVKLMFYDENNELINPNVADIRIDFDDMGGAWSYLGTDCLSYKDKSEATMNFGWFDVPTVLHEFCHALGMVHEHQNPKGKVILWDKNRVYRWGKETQGWSTEKVDEQIIERYKLDEINGSTFDSKSIMLYFFPGNLVLDPNTNQCCGTGTNQNQMFSPYDVLYLNYNYPLKNSSLTSEQFTVKFFNDVFNQQVDIDDLKKQLDSTRAEETGGDDTAAEKSAAANALKPVAANALKPGAGAANALKNNMSDVSLCKPTNDDFVFYVLIVIVLLLLIVLGVIILKID